ncbi:MAG TPA: TraR/DksA C4-type zinc finger protein [Gemmatimonadaceae bacterium]|jgi:RNA polymerase-binding transcription factor DksA|nr:TraR/DksA C4-type zinc finger protein [Gemmatimonadaceae bacterium]
MSASPALTKAELREIEKELQRERARLERTLASANGVDTGNGDVPAATGEPSAPTSADGAIGVMLENRTQARYEAIVAALERLVAGTYGTCGACANPIPYGRLLVMPEATHCVRCGIHV